ncbi:hypothetical protein RS9916_28229 [Synechococcus sp. RS9916]|nr:hypothetical protein RS9916_28229 [Synechococcus sp. RS9916]
MNSWRSGSSTQSISTYGSVAPGQSLRPATPMRDRFKTNTSSLLEAQLSGDAHHR